MPHLYKELQPDSINFTYGYLGLFSDLYFKNKLTIHNNLYVIDHPPVTGDLKGSVFRLHHADSSLTSQMIFHNHLSSEQINNLSESIKSLQDNSSISLSFPVGSCKSLFSNSANKNIGLFIKPSSVLSTFKHYSESFYLSYLNSINLHSGDLCHKHPLISMKKWELSLSKSGQIQKQVYQVEEVNLVFNQIKFVYCATSMLFIQFILKSIPVYLSSSHPCFHLCGSYIPALSKSEAISFAEYLTSRTTISFENLNPLLEQLSVQATDSLC